MPNQNTKSIPKNINQYDAGDMYAFVADNCYGFHTSEAKRYEKEWEQLKGDAQ